MSSRVRAISHDGIPLLTSADPDFTSTDVALQRINKFLTETPLIDRFEAALVPGAINDDPSYIGFNNASFTWGKKDENDPAARSFTLQLDNLHFKPGKVNIIAGPTGSGKTSLLMALLGEMHFVPKGPGANFSLPRTGGVSYASQQSWLQNKTLKDNILFGTAFDETRYRQVVHQCALERDFTLFDAGDETEVGGQCCSGSISLLVSSADRLGRFSSDVLQRRASLSAEARRRGSRSPAPSTRTPRSFCSTTSSARSTSTPPSGSSRSSSHPRSSATGQSCL